eukprot:15458941-Alexandrium_andersonii.AAC.1
MYEQQMKIAEEKYARETQARNDALQKIAGACVSECKLREEIDIRLHFASTRCEKLKPEFDQPAATLQQKDALLAEGSEETNRLMIAHSNVQEEAARARL